MGQIRYRFHKELNDFIKPTLRNVEIISEINRKASVKDIIETYGVPHTEVALILVNEIAVDFSYIVQDGDTICVYPLSECSEKKQLLKLRPEPPLTSKFVVDANLGRLARYLRLLGFDCLYHNNYSDDMVATISNEDNRIVLTRDRSLLQRKIITYGYFVRATIPKIQVKEILKRFNLFQLIAPFIRCTRCNGTLEKIDKLKIEHRLKPLTRQYYNDFLICTKCRQIYWQGGHYTRAMQLINEFRAMNIR